MRLGRSFYCFLVVGLAGFCVDASIFFLLTHHGATFVVARIPASVIAIVVTWGLNRTYSFSVARRGRRSREIALYFGASLLGALGNLIAGFPVSLFDDSLWQIPSYLVGTMTGLVINFTLYKFVVFVDRRVP